MCTVLRPVAETVPSRTREWIEAPPWRVADVRRETGDTVTLDLMPPDTFSFLPGQFNMLSLPGIGEVPISVSGDPAASGHVLHTIREVGAVTRALCALRPGHEVGVRGPYGTHWPLEAAAGGDLVIIAGGIGLPPLRPTVYQALAQRDRFGRIILLYGARTRGTCFSRRSLPPGGPGSTWTSRSPSTRPTRIGAATLVRYRA